MATNTKALICLIYFINVTKYFTALTGKDDSPIEQIACFVDNEAEGEGIPTLDQPLAAQTVHAIYARLVKEMATKPGASAEAGQTETATRRWPEALSAPSSHESCRCYSRSCC